MPRIGLGLGLGLRQAVAAAGGYDPDAQAFFNRVTTAGGTLTTTEKNATNQLVLDMKSAGIWTSMKAVYPMVGASAAACAQNLVSASFTGTFTSGWTFASTGATPNGSSAYMDTGLNLNTMNSINDISYGYYSRTNNQSTGSFGWGVPSALSPLNEFWIRYTDGNKYGYLFDNANDGGAVSDCRGFNAMSRIASTTKYIQLNSSIVTYSSASSGSLSSRNFIFAQGSQGYEDRENAFGFVANGLTSTNLSNFYTAVQTFNQTLNRQVGAQIVSDADAQAYINRVYTAGGTLTNTEANAVNQLVIDMKAAGIWTAMKAVYPMVGSSAAACAQNLKSSSYTGTFTSGWTFASTGATPNGTSAYMDTGFVPSTQSSLNNAHYSIYIRTNLQSLASIGASDLSYLNIVYINPRYTDNKYYNHLNALNSDNGTSSDSRGFWDISTVTSGQFSTYLNSTKLSTKIRTAIGLTSNNVWIGGANTQGALEYSDRQCAFASIGDGLTDTQAADFYTCVQTFNTSLSRQV